MEKYILSILFVSYIITLNSCITEFENDANTSDVHLVVRCDLEAGQHSPRVYLSSSFNHNSDVFRFDDNVSVELYEDGNTKPIVLSKDPFEESLWIANDSRIFSPGKLYFLRIDAHDFGFPLSLSETSIPVKRKASQLAVSFKGDSDRVEMQYQFEKSLGAGVFFHILAYVKDSAANRKYLPTFNHSENFNMPGILEGASGILIDYSKLNEDKHLSFMTDFASIRDNNIPNTGYLILEMRTVTEDYFKYLYSIRENNENISNPFSLPTTTFTNINNGYGLFSGYSVYRDSLEIE